ncbi:MAG: helix-turn-helix domain-containing protein [Nakamurella sp.]
MNPSRPRTPQRSPLPVPLPYGPIASDTLRAIERATSGLSTRSVARMDQQFSWFRALSAEQRSWVTIVAQAGIAGYVGWVNNPTNNVRIAEQVFTAAPRELLRAVSLRRTVELVRVAITVAEEELPAIAETVAEQAALRESLLRYSREIAFAAAAVYATAAETRGAWDARVEAAIVDGLVRGEDSGALESRAAALSWDSAGPAQILVGAAPQTSREQAVVAVGEWSRSAHRRALAAVHGTMLIVVLSGESPPSSTVTDLFGRGSVIRGPVAPGLAAASRSATEALSAYRVAPAWPAAPPLVESSELLPERVLAGDATAIELLRREIFAPLAASSAPLLETLDSYIAHGGSLEPAARSIFVHPNTMRYRLRRVTDITGRDPWSPRDMLTLTLALILGRLAPPLL